MHFVRRLQMLRRTLTWEMAAMPWLSWRISPRRCVEDMRLFVNPRHWLTWTCSVVFIAVYNKSVILLSKWVTLNAADSFMLLKLTPLTIFGEEYYKLGDLSFSTMCLPLLLSECMNVHCLLQVVFHKCPSLFAGTVEWQWYCWFSTSNLSLASSFGEIKVLSYETVGGFCGQCLRVTWPVWSVCEYRSYRITHYSGAVI